MVEFFKIISFVKFEHTQSILACSVRTGIVAILFVISWFGLMNIILGIILIDPNREIRNKMLNAGELLINNTAALKQPLQ